MRRWSFSKGHGTENDFVLIQDRESMLHVGEAEVRAICHRHAGIGADGLLRAVKAKHIDGWDGDGELWFMDYRNADGSIAETCGNGLRVFARYLLDEGLASGRSLEIATRAGLMEATALPDGRFRVSMGSVQVGHEPVTVTTSDGRSYQATSIEVGNPHAVSFADDLDGLSLTLAPSFSPAEAFPKGVNFEFVRVVAERHIAMLVYERGVGETRSCGTGTVAAAAAAAAREPSGDPEAPTTYRVDVLGGVVEVELAPEQAFL
ncbi:MAG: diaminopimelate epimerase, partial [Propionibacteriaceae bacterium]|nr:diaminopimelate epimerase [Propionibacteriaceae bacterium]